MTAFRQLIIGDTFDWVNDGNRNSFYAPCWKTGARSYQEIANPAHSYTVGSINAEVFHVNEFIRTTINGVSNPPGATRRA